MAHTDNIELYDVTIIGAGIIGLATARELLIKDKTTRVLLLEKEGEICKHQTGHNSGVIHSGIYYKPGSLKAKLCLKGRQMMYEYCEKNKVPFKKIGKLIVAANQEESVRLKHLYQNGLENGLKEIEWLDESQLKKLEPNCVGLNAILSPETGIVDFRVVSLSILNEILELGANISYHQNVKKISSQEGMITINTDKKTFHSKNIISCAGIYSDRVAKLSMSSPYPKIVPFRGDYLLLKKESHHLVNKLIYPVPDPSFPFLGVHFTPRIDGEVWLGPNAVPAFSREGYKFLQINIRDSFETFFYPGFQKLAFKYWKMGLKEMYRDLFAKSFLKCMQKYIPAIQISDCLPGPSGIRAQAMNLDGSLVDDFVFDTSKPNILHVRNAPSPAATSSLAIAEEIVKTAQNHFSN